jgi:hypothetical protein
VKAPPEVLRQIQDMEDAEKAERDLGGLIGLANHAGFSKAIGWLRDYEKYLVGICCTVGTDDEETKVSRAELRLLRGFLSMFEEAAEKHPQSVKFLQHLQAKAKWWQTIGIDIERYRT